jgi:hypothetical protein
LINNDIAVVPVQPNLQKAEAGPVPVSSNETIDDTAKVEPQAVLHAEKKPVADLPKPDIKNIPVTTVAVTPASVKKTVAETKKPDAIVTPDKTNTSVAINPATEKKEARPDEPAGRVKSEPIAKTLVKQEQPVVKNQSPPIKQPAAIVNKSDTKSVAISNPVPEKKVAEPVITPEIPEVKKPVADVTVKAAVIEGRKSEFSQVVNFKADSLELSLYDNGEIDGDTVSVFMNGEVLLSRQGLKASAIKKTIYITPGNEDFTLVLFADNLGKYPPNTGLLVVHDGEDVYNLRFSSDLQKSAGIVFRRKK